MDSDLEEVLYYFMKLGKNRGMESRVGKDKKKRVMEIFEKMKLKENWMNSGSGHVNECRI